MTDNSSSNKIINDNVDIDRSMLKIAVLAVLSVGSFSLFGYFLKLFFQNNDIQSASIAGFFTVLFLIAFLFQTIFIKSLKINVLIIFLSCVGLLGAFYEQISNSAVLIGAALVFLSLFFANLNGVRELKNSLKISFWKINKTILPKAIAAIFLFMSIIYIYANTTGNQEFFISQKSFEKIVLSPAIIVAQRFYPEVDTSLTINELAVNLAKKQIQEIPELSVLPPAAQKMMVNQAAAEFEKQIVGYIGDSININKKATIGEIIYETIKSKFNSLSENIKSLVLMGVVLTIFMSLEILAMPIRFVISIIAFLIYELLLAFGFATIELEGRSKEMVVLK